MTQNMYAVNKLGDPAMDAIIDNMIDTALSGVRLDRLYAEREICLALRYSLIQKYPGNKFIIQSYNGSHVLAATGKIDDHAIHARAAGLNIKSTPTRFEAKNIFDLFTCFVVLDGVK